MPDLLEFLHVRGVPEEAVSVMEEQKVTEKEIYVGLMPGVYKNKERLRI